MGEDVLDPGTGEGGHAYASIFLLGGSAIRPILWLGDVGGDPPHRLEAGGIPQQSVLLDESQEI